MEAWNILEILPPEVMILVFSNLEPEDIASSLSVSKLWNALHSGFDWKEAYAVTFGELSESSVDLSQQFNWQKLFFERKALSQMRKRKVNSLIKPLGKNANAKILSVTNDHMVYQVIDSAHESFFVVDLRAYKSDPFLALDKITVARPSLSLLKKFSAHVKNRETVTFNGYLTNGEGETVHPHLCLFWNLKKAVKSLPSATFPEYYNHFSYAYSNVYVNSKYILLDQYPRGCLIDTSKTCYHYCTVDVRGQTYEREKLPIVCNKDKCALIDSWNQRYWDTFLSELDPDVLVIIKVNYDDYYELEVSRIGQHKSTVVLAQVGSEKLRRKVKIGSEHVVKTKGRKIMHHWFSFEINETWYFVDLVDTSRKIKMPPATVFKWIPNQSKIALAKNNILIIYDLEKAARCSKMAFKNRIYELSVFRSFIAVHEAGFVSICHWETATSQAITEIIYASHIQLLSENLLMIYNNYEAFCIHLAAIPKKKAQQ